MKRFLELARSSKLMEKCTGNFNFDFMSHLCFGKGTVKDYIVNCYFIYMQPNKLRELRANHSVGQASI